MSDEKTAATWDACAEAFDGDPDHGLTDPLVHAAWRKLFEDLLPGPPATIADLGCGTGSVAVLLGEMGHVVSGFDFAPAMLELARAKAKRHGLEIPFTVADAAAPPLAPASVDVVVVRHVVWALPAPELAIARWLAALAPGGRIVLIEGFWSTGAGLHGYELMTLVTHHIPDAELRPLTDAALWGRPIEDERYAIIART